MLSRFHLITGRIGQTDRQTDRFAISISRVSVLTRDKNHSILMKFCTQQQILNWMNVTWSKMKKLHWTDSEFDRTYFLFIYYIFIYVVYEYQKQQRSKNRPLWYSMHRCTHSKPVSTGLSFLVLEPSRCYASLALHMAMHYVCARKLCARNCLLVA